MNSKAISLYSLRPKSEPMNNRHERRRSFTESGRAAGTFAVVICGHTYMSILSPDRGWFFCWKNIEPHILQITNGQKVRPQVRETRGRCNQIGFAVGLAEGCRQKADCQWVGQCVDKQTPPRSFNSPAPKLFLVEGRSRSAELRAGSRSDRSSTYVSLPGEPDSRPLDFVSGWPTACFGRPLLSFLKTHENLSKHRASRISRSLSGTTATMARRVCSPQPISSADS